MKKTRTSSRPPDFSKATKQKVKDRAGARCSNPNCGRPTTGPVGDSKSGNVGDAAHIKGARPGKKRYDVTMTDKSRAALENAIWLCATCHRLVDSDEDQFTAETLVQWKESHENKSGAGYRGENISGCARLSMEPPEILAHCERLSKAVKLYFTLLDIDLFEIISNTKVERIYTADMFEEAGVNFSDLVKSTLYGCGFTELTCQLMTYGPPDSVTVSKGSEIPDGYCPILAMGKPRIAVLFIPIAASAVRNSLLPIEELLPWNGALPIFKNVRSMKDWADVCAGSDLKLLKAEAGACCRTYFEEIDTVRRRVER